MADSGLLFIPDISGFTKFVNETEIEHSRIIIEELLENIINSNKIGLHISEVEGDAILFYRFGETPSLEEISNQVEKMFCNFQKQIKNYESARMCTCAACMSAVNLSLKRKPIKCIAIALEFDAVQFAVNHGDVDPDGSRPKPHFLDNTRPIIANILAIQSR